MPGISWSERMISTNLELAESLKIRVTDFIPHQPTPKQRLFLSLPQREAFFGGAAGGGKSDALLMGALQYVDIPKYRAIIFRRTLTDLRLPDALIDRSMNWLKGKAKFSGNAWHFPSGAIIQFGYLDSIDDKYRYQGSAYQYIAFDELTHFRESDYLYLFSRNRRTRCPIHKNQRPVAQCRDCQLHGELSRIPLRIRSASNPGGGGHAWVKRRFDIGKIPGKTRMGRPLYMGRCKYRPHIPAFIEDNPHLDQLEYVRSLHNLDPITREQLLSGDWGITQSGRFNRKWIEQLRYANINNRPHERRCRYRITGQYFQLGDSDSHDLRDFSELTTFFIIDPAATIIEGPGDIQRRAKKESWTVISVFKLTPDNELLIYRVYRCRSESPEIYRALKEMAAEEQPAFIGMELTAISSHFYSYLKRTGLPMRAFKPKGRDKIARATDAMNRMEQGRIWLPYPDPSNPHLDWLEDFELEIFTWTGDPEETDDQVDTLAYAAMYVSQRAFGNHKEEKAVKGSVRELPSAF